MKDTENLDSAKEGYQNDRGMQREIMQGKDKNVTLKTRRVRADMLEVFKILKGYEGTNRDCFSEYS